MITKGKIIKVNEKTLDVRIPVFEASGTSDEIIVEDCPVCYNPGVLNGYREDDVVFVGFENNDIGNPIVLGKLYAGIEEGASAYAFFNSLKVEGNTELSEDTFIAGVPLRQLTHYKDDLATLYQIIDQIESEEFDPTNYYTKTQINNKFVPYTGAISNVNIGDYWLIAGGVSIHTTESGDDRDAEYMFDSIEFHNYDQDTTNILTFPETTGQFMVYREIDSWEDQTLTLNDLCSGNQQGFTIIRYKRVPGTYPASIKIYLKWGTVLSSQNIVYGLRLYSEDFTKTVYFSSTSTTTDLNDFINDLEWENVGSDIFVPYTGATSNVDLGLNNLKAESVSTDTFDVDTESIKDLYDTLNESSTFSTTRKKEGIVAFNSSTGDYSNFNGVWAVQMRVGSTTPIKMVIWGKCLTSNYYLPESFINNSDAETTHISALYNNLKTNLNITFSGANEYDSTATYAVGDIVWNNGKIYKCNTAITTAESWDPSHWTEVTISNLDYVDLTSAQTVAGVKTFSSYPVVKGITFKNNVLNPTGNTLEVANDNGYNGKVIFAGKGIMFTGGSVLPTTYVTGNNIESLGAAGYLWNNLYLKNNLIDNNGNSLPISEITSNSFFNASQYDSTSTYSVGDRSIYKNKLYECTSAITTAEAWDSTHWVEIKISDYQLLINSTNKLSADLVEDTSTTHKFTTSADKLKLTNIEAGAQVNVLEGVQVNGTDLSISSKKVNIITNTSYDATTNPIATMTDISGKANIPSSGTVLLGADSGSQSNITVGSGLTLSGGTLSCSNTAGSGTALYKHTVSVTDSNSDAYTINVVNTSNTQISSIEDLYNALQSIETVRKTINGSSLLLYGNCDIVGSTGGVTNVNITYITLTTLNTLSISSVASDTVTAL